jgi:hypothetical protein
MTVKLDLDLGSDRLHDGASGRGVNCHWTVDGGCPQRVRTSVRLYRSDRKEVAGDQ